MYSPDDRLLFSSNLFSAHAAPSSRTASSVWDEGGWGAYGADWQHYYDCMLAPVARQAAGEGAGVLWGGVEASGSTVLIACWCRWRASRRVRGPWVQRGGVG